MSATYGAFIDAVEKAAEECGEAEVFFEEWKAMVDEEKWAAYHEMELIKWHVVGVAKHMANMFRARIQGICTDALYAQTVRAGHDFLADIHEAAVELEIDIDLDEVDMPLTPTEQLVLIHRDLCSRPEKN